eukprot:2471443-Rhodomonas_salina.3
MSVSYITSATQLTEYRTPRRCAAPYAMPVPTPDITIRHASTATHIGRHHHTLCQYRKSDLDLVGVREEA